MTTPTTSIMLPKADKRFKFVSPGASSVQCPVWCGQYQWTYNSVGAQPWCQRIPTYYNYTVLALWFPPGHSVQARAGRRLILLLRKQTLSYCHYTGHQYTTPCSMKLNRSDWYLVNNLWCLYVIIPIVSLNYDSNNVLMCQKFYGMSLSS